MTRILGIDPGSLVMGYAVIDQAHGQLHYVASGCLRLPAGPLAQRLRDIYEGISQLIRTHQPTEVVVEEVFVSQNVASAIKLGQARGAAICAAATAGLPVHEYTPAVIKQSLVGHGRADKRQVQHMVKVLLGLQGELQPDAADALAVAICHAHSQGRCAAAVLPFRRGRR
ncbi:MAG TPA: crossover junction endodeoxyribonuclease RuvC [Nevskiales bacterium]|nr:crossover junction endodeoxyribonuclease RuvC [Nevskiales bacterium]